MDSFNFGPRGINKNIIRGIAALFLIMLTAILGYAFASADYSTSKIYLPNFASGWMTDILNSNLFSVVMGINIILGLWLTDTILRKRNTTANYNNE